MAEAQNQTVKEAEDEAQGKGRNPEKDVVVAWAKSRC